MQWQMILRKIFTVVLLSIVWVTTFASQSVGLVDFKVPCSKASAQSFDHALAQIHNMMYVQAQAEFAKITETDPKCGMAYWGQALSIIHPLWADSPSEKELKEGQEQLKKARQLTDDARMLAYIRALEAYYNDWDTLSDAKRIANWALAQQKLLKLYPDDPDAIAFAALLHLATADKADKTYSHQRQAGAMLENLHEKHPLHPAGYLYTIHAYDNEELAPKALEIARGYDKIAPDVPYALHMPSHIFVRLGLWPETVDWNIRSAKAARAQPLADGSLSMHYAHALDYLMYAYLQQGQYKKAQEVYNQLNQIQKIEGSFPAAHGLAAARARFYIEQQRWDEAKQMPDNLPAGFPWQQFPQAQAVTYFSRGMAAVFAGDLKTAEKNVLELNVAYTETLLKKESYWAALTRAKREALEAWIEFKKGRRDSGLVLMKAAAKAEDALDKHPVTPSEVMPARELYAKMLMEEKSYEEALKNFELALKISPNRLQSLYGAALAAEKMGDRVLAARYYRKMIEITENHEGTVVGLQRAKEFVKKMQLGAD